MPKRYRQEKLFLLNPSAQSNPNNEPGQLMMAYKTTTCFTRFGECVCGSQLRPSGTQTGFGVPWCADATPSNVCVNGWGTGGSSAIWVALGATPCCGCGGTTLWRRIR